MWYTFPHVSARLVSCFVPDPYRYFCRCRPKNRPYATDGVEQLGCLRAHD